MTATRVLLSALVALTLCVAGLVLGLLFGVVHVPAATVLAWVTGHDVPQQAALVLGSVRLPRLVTGALCGAALALSGGVMQIWTANPLAGPGLLGLNSGSAAALALAVSFAPWLAPGPLVGIGMIGAALGGLLVLAALTLVPGGDSPLRLTVIGAMVTAMLTSVTTTLVIANGMQTDLLYWTVGGLGAVGWREAGYMAAAVTIGGALIALVSRDLAVLALGSASARALGLQTNRLRVLVGLLLTLLAGTANAVAGPVGFVGFLSPHLARRIAGASPRVMLPFAALTGALLVIAADAVGRVVTPPDEQPLGLFMALAGAPVLIAVALKRYR
jgi:iron complex transport system permease protein